MQIPFPILKGVSGGSSAALIALLAGLVLVTAMKNQPNPTARRPGS